jgi:hypothetical protein
MCIKDSEVIVLKNGSQQTANSAAQYGTVALLTTQLLSAFRLYKQTNE